MHDANRGSLRGWLWTITLNKLRNFARRAPPQATGGTDLYERLLNLPETLPPESSDDAQQDARHSHEGGNPDERRLVQRALDQIRGEFAPHNWQAFTLSVLEGWDTARIAAELGTTPNNVRQAKSRILRRLREQLGE